ncbi:MAG: hypothetical protein IJW92_04710 [Clostridia bacterium]|nr:hypothetical protein [Clostridia bacterium]
MKTPISLIIDDPAPVVSVYHEHAKSRTTKDGRPLIPTFSNSLLFQFCDIVEKHSIKGKFSVVPMPGNKGDIVSGLEGVAQADLQEWLDTVKARVVPSFTIGPELLTHHQAVDLATGASLGIKECDWASTQNRTTLTPYIAKALTLLKQAGFSSYGVTSPWNFGIEVEDEYVASISQAVYEVSGSKNAWYFLRALRDVPNAKPWIALEDGERTVVSIPATTRDHIWQTIDTARTDQAYIHAVADMLITQDGKSGEIIRVLERDGWPILCTHWQSLMSNGLGTGLRVLDEVADRINRLLFDRVVWMRFSDIMELVLSDKASYPKPIFQ